MCGIVFLISSRPHPVGSKARHTCECEVREAMRRLRHRGPDWSGQWTSPDGLLFAGHERLAIVSYFISLRVDNANNRRQVRPESGRQPIIEDSLVLVVNGEIYNYERWPDDDDSPPSSDCVAILRSYLQLGSSIYNEARGKRSNTKGSGKTATHDVLVQDSMEILHLYAFFRFVSCHASSDNILGVGRSRSARRHCCARPHGNMPSLRCRI